MHLVNRILHPEAGAQRWAEVDPVRVVTVDLAELRLPGRPFRVVASPPYGAGTELVRLLLRSERLISADLVRQRRRPGGWSSVPAAAGPALPARARDAVPRRTFDPAPRVDSAVLWIRRR